LLSLVRPRTRVITVADRVLIPLPGVGTLSLTREAFEAALIAGAPAPAVLAAEEERLLDAGELALALSLPKSCIYERSRTGEFPSVRVGKHVRFKRSAVLAAIDSKSVGRR
jgi:excisionase family DNA binding protein